MEEMHGNDLECCVQITQSFLLAPGNLGHDFLLMPVVGRGEVGLIRIWGGGTHESTWLLGKCPFRHSLVVSREIGISTGLPLQCNHDRVRLNVS